jgi:glycosyltransferase involved in cell wall biosynthesis
LAFADRASTPHVALVHHPLRRRTQLFQRTTRFLHRLDRVVVLSRVQERYLRDEVGLAPERIRFVYDKVDHRFWTSRGAPSDGSVLAVGTQGRDYRTLIAALGGTGIPVTIVAGSLWVGADTRDLDDLPANVATVTGLTFEDLRSCYERAAVVVVPLERDLRYAGGVNAVLEGMAMGKAVVVSATPGISDYVEDGVTARVVPPGDPTRLRAVVADLLADSRQRSALGTRARALIDRDRNLDTFVRAVAGIAQEARDGASPAVRRH